MKGNNMNGKKINYKLINITALMLLLYITVSNLGTWYNIIGTIIHVTFPFLIAFTIAYALTPIIRWAEKKKIRKSIAVTTLVIVLVGIIILLLANLLPMIYDQLILLSKTIAKAIHFFSDKFDINLGSFEIRIDKYLNDAISNLGQIISTGTVDIVSKSVGVIGNTIVVFIASIYFLVYMDNIRHSVASFFKKISKKALSYIICLDQEIGNYIKGLSIFMIIQFVEYSLLFRIVGHPNWLILGFLACITTVIPYFGGLITNIIALILASVTNSRILIGTLIICLIFPQIDGYLISPKVYGKTNNVNPLITIMAVSVGGTLAGITGIIAALPVYLLIRCTYHFYKEDLKMKFASMKDVME